MGMKTGRNDKGWEIAVCPVKMTKKGQELFKKDTIVSPWIHKSKLDILKVTHTVRTSNAQRHHL